MAVEQQSTAGTILISTLVATLGPLAGQYTVIVLAGFAGSMVALSRNETKGIASGAGFLLRGIMFSVFLASAVAELAAPKIGASAYVLIAPAAFLLGLLADKWSDMRDFLISKFTKKDSNGTGN